MPKRDRIIMVLERMRKTDISTLEETILLVSEAVKDSHLADVLDLVNLSFINVDAEQKDDAPR